MREQFSTHLDERDRKWLGILTALLAISLVFLLFVSLRERNSYYRTARTHTVEKENFEKVKEARAESERQWRLWEEAKQDYDVLKTDYFYRERDVIEAFMQDLRNVFSESGIYVSRIKYDYVDIGKVKMRKINATFNFSGSYLMLKRFLGVVERFPKFLILEKIDFVDIADGGNSLELKIILAGYYEN